MLRSAYRPTLAIGIGYTLCVMAIIEAFDCGNAPQWFLAFAIPVVGGLLVERGVRKSKGDD